MGIETDLNVSPYYDDANNAINENYHRILFRPSVAVQARELTQLQDILQNQIERFGDNIFVSGTILKGCNFNFDTQYNYVNILDNRPIDTIPVTASSYVNLVGYESTSNLYAICVNYQDGYESQAPNLKTLYFKYLNTGVAGQSAFSPGSQIKFYSTTEIAGANASTLVANGDVTVASVSNAVGIGYAMSVSSGVIFQKGHFIQVANNSTAIVSKYTNAPNNAVTGFYIQENIVTELSDTNLYDPASGSTNFNAPGAHRLQLTPVLTTYPADSAPSNNFLALVEWENGNIVRSFQQTQYSGLGNELARRTKEESGDYFIKPFKLHMENVNTTHNYIVSSAGLAYIDGHRVEQLSNIKTNVRKGTDVKNVKNQILNTSYDNSIVVKEYVGNIPSNVGATISLTDSAGAKVTAGGGSITVSGNVIGTAKVLSVQFDSGIVGTPTAQYRIYLSDVRMNSGNNFKDSKGVYYSGSAKGFADVITALDKTTNTQIVELSQPSKGPLIFKTAKSGLQNLNSAGVLPDYTYSTVSNVAFNTTAAGNTNSITLSGSTIFPYGYGALSTDQERSIVVTPISFVSGANSANVTLTKSGTIQYFSSNAVVNGTSTAFTSEYQVGDFICIDTIVKQITAIGNNTSMTLSNTFATANSGAHHHKCYQLNVPINFAERQSSMTVTDAAQQNMVMSLIAANGSYEVLTTNAVFSVYHNALIPTDADKGLQANTVTVRINVGNNAANSPYGPFCLGIPYAYNLRSVYSSSNSFSFQANTTASSNQIATDTTAHSFVVGGVISGAWSNAFPTTATVTAVGANTVNVDTAASSTLANTQMLLSYYATGSTDGIDVTSQYTIDTNQKDGIIDLSYLKLKQTPYGWGTRAGGSDLLTVTFDAMMPTNTGKGYISVDSYYSLVSAGTINWEDIPSYTSPAGTTYELRDSIDFRPFVSNTAAYTSTLASTTVNPSNTSALPASENYIVAPNQTFKYNLNYYVGRIDKLLINTYGAYSVIEGSPSETPAAPADKLGSMTLATINVPPLPSLANTTNVSNTAQKYLVTFVGANQNRGYTMKDIGKLDQRLNQVEYYTALNLLEQKTSQLTVVSSVTGANRFKNGIFVDGFDNLDSTDYTNPEFRAAISSSESAIVPMYTQDRIALRFANSTNGAVQGRYITLANTTPTVALSQKFATTTHTCTDITYSYTGQAVAVVNYVDTPDTDTKKPAANTTLPANTTYTANVTPPVQPTPDPVPPLYSYGQLVVDIYQHSTGTRLFHGYSGTGAAPGGFVQIPNMSESAAASLISRYFNLTTAVPTYPSILGLGVLGGIFGSGTTTTATTQVSYTIAGAFDMHQYGFFIPTYTGTHTFTSFHDDAWCLWVNGSILANQSGDFSYASTTSSGIYLEKGRMYPFWSTLYANGRGTTAWTLTYTVNGLTYTPDSSNFARSNDANYVYSQYNSLAAADNAANTATINYDVGLYGYNIWTGGVYSYSAIPSLNPTITTTSPYTANAPTTVSTINLNGAMYSVPLSINTAAISAASPVTASAYNVVPIVKDIAIAGGGKILW